MIGKKFLLNTSAIALATAFLPGLVRADVPGVVLDSQAGLTACLFVYTPSTSCGAFSPLGYTGSIATPGITTSGSVAITPDYPPATPNAGPWAPNNPINPGDGIAGDVTDSAAVWIGAVKSGEGDPDFVASNFSGLPVYEITQTFTLAVGGSLNLDVWADDTVNVLLDGHSIANLPAPAFPIQNSTCQGIKISCTLPNDGVATGVPVVGVGTHTLTFDVWQTGTGLDTSSNPTGLLYTGFVTDSGTQPTNGLPTPEAGVVPTLLSMLIGLAAFAGIFKKKLA